MSPRVAIAAMALLLSAAACRGAPRSYRPPLAPLPALTYSAIMAPPQTRGAHRELAALESATESPTAQLRAASILLATRQHERALSKLNGLIYGSVQHGPSVESFARFLRANAFELRGETDRAQRERTLARASVVDPQLRAELDRRLVASKPKPAALADARVRPRHEWKARRATKMVPMSKIRRVTIHHSAVLSRDRDAAAAIAMLQSIQRYHQEERAWADIAYHYLIDPAGRIWQGRHAKWQGAHAGDFEKNRGNLGICLLGNFLRKNQDPTPEQVRALESLTAMLLENHGLSRQAIRTHSELKATPCPGENLQAVVDRMRGFTVAAGSE